MTEFSSPVYRTWDEAMAAMDADPDLLGKPWAVADPDAPPRDPADPVDWSGWVSLGYTDEGMTFTPNGQPFDKGAPPLPSRVDLGPGELFIQREAGDG